MAHAEAHDPQVLRHYEGLVHATARRYAPYVEDEFEDVAQILRIKVFRALLSFDPARSILGRDSYVFSCVKNQAKDLIRRRRRGELYIEDIAPDAEGFGTRDRFEARYLSECHDDVYSTIEDDDLVVPSTLDPLERRVIVLLYRDYKQVEVMVKLGLARRDMERLMKSIRSKMADWKPSVAELAPQSVLGVAA